jgi:hypothetical protein
VRNARLAKRLDTTQMTEVQPVSYFETCERRWPERRCDWEALRTFGQLPLFGVSYTILILVPITLFLISFYNQKVDVLRGWAGKVKQSEKQLRDKLPRQVADPMVTLARTVDEKLHHQPIDGQSLFLFGSTVLLAIASTIYTIWCPTRIKEFSKDRWCDELRKPLIHYWPLSWSHRTTRIICWVCYLIGGTVAIWVIACKVWWAFGYIVEHSTFSLW